MNKYDVAAQKRYERHVKALQKAAEMIALAASNPTTLHVGIDISKALLEAYACRAFEKRAGGNGRSGNSSDAGATDSGTEAV